MTHSCRQALLLCVGVIDVGVNVAGGESSVRRFWESKNSPERRNYPLCSLCVAVIVHAAVTDVTVTDVLCACEWLRTCLYPRSALPPPPAVPT